MARRRRMLMPDHVVEALRRKYPATGISWIDEQRERLINEAWGGGYTSPIDLRTTKVYRIWFGWRSATAIMGFARAYFEQTTRPRTFEYQHVPSLLQKIPLYVYGDLTDAEKEDQIARQRAALAGGGGASTHLRYWGLVEPAPKDHTAAKFRDGLYRLTGRDALLFAVGLGTVTRAKWACLNTILGDDEERVSLHEARWSKKGKFDFQATANWWMEYVLPSHVDLAYEAEATPPGCELTEVPCDDEDFDDGDY
jgi:hypothetical protein